MNVEYKNKKEIHKMEIDIDREIEDLEKREARDKYLYGQMPKILIEDERISSSAKVLFSAYHLKCSNKSSEDLINGRCSTYIGQEALSRIFKCYPGSIKRWQKELEKYDYIRIAPRKSEYKTNIVTLNLPQNNKKDQNKATINGGIK